MSTHRPRSRHALLATPVLLGLLGGLVLLPGAVLGHAELATSDPADGATISDPPTEIVQTYTQNLDPGRSALVLVDAAGAEIARGGVEPGDDERTMRITDPPALAPGAYTIRWTTFSTEDNELHRGETTFTLLFPSPTPRPTPSPEPSATPAPTASPSPSPSPSPAPSSSADPGSTSGSADVLIPIVAGIVIVALLGAWLLRGRRARP